MDKKIFYLRRCRAAAEEAGRAFDMNPRVILAQGALESGWGTSCLATEHNNYFGIMGYGASNAWWHGERVELETAGAWSFSRIPEAYAKEIAYSPYISELNGDNRERYRHSIIALEEEIGRMMDWDEGMVA